MNRINDERATLHTLRERVRCQELWVKGAQRYRNPDDLPADFAAKRVAYYQALEKPSMPTPLSPPSNSRWIKHYRCSTRGCLRIRS